jgi:hypothetical protein
MTKLTMPNGQELTLIPFENQTDEQHKSIVQNEENIIGTITFPDCTIDFDIPKEWMEVDVEGLAEEANGYAVYAKETKAPIFKEGFIEGYSQAPKGEFTEEDMCAFARFIKSIIVVDPFDLKMKIKPEVSESGKTEDLLKIFRQSKLRTQFIQICKEQLCLVNPVVLDFNLSGDAESENIRQFQEAESQVFKGTFLILKTK